MCFVQENKRYYDSNMYMINFVLTVERYRDDFWLEMYARYVANVNFVIE